MTVMAVAAVALIAAFVANRYLRSRLVPDSEEGMSVRDLVTPLLTLTVLLLAFTLVTASSSYKRAEEAARAEAHAVDHLSEVAAYAPEGERERILADVICYARAVQEKGWPAMADGHSSTVANVWSSDFRATFGQVSEHAAFGMLVSADDARAKARQDRLAEATPAIPSLIFWFLMVTLAVTVIALGLCIPRKGKAQLASLVLVTALLSSALVIIRDADRPFGGLIAVPPASLAAIEDQATEDFLENNGRAELPCDGQGRETATPATATP